MIAKAKAISHGINDIRYITGESHNKKHPEKIYRVLDNMMPSEPIIRKSKCSRILKRKVHFTKRNV